MGTLTRELQEYCKNVSDIEIYCYDYQLNEKHFNSLNDYLNSNEYKNEFTDHAVLTFNKGEK